VRSIELKTEDSLRLAVVEANPNDPASFSESSGLDSLLPEAISDIPATASMSDFPKLLADSIERRLTSRSHPSLFHVGYAGISVMNGSVVVASAGNCRVHLVSEERLLAVTHDHNIIDDPIEGIDLDKVGENLRATYRYIESRQIAAVRNGNGPLHRAEVLEWTAPKIFQIIIASSFTHQFREPEAYLPRFEKPKSSEDVGPLGFAMLVNVDRR